MKKVSKQTLDGNVETFLLAIIESQPSYGYAIVKELNNRAEGLLKLGEGTIYPVLHRLEAKKLISANWRTAENGRNRKYYRITQKGKKALSANFQQWQILTQIMHKVAGVAENLTPSPQLKGA
jgi:DNA-binding PadR family transcriptional regulator